MILRDNIPRNEKCSAYCRARVRIAQAIPAGSLGGDGQALLCAETRSKAVFE